MILFTQKLTIAKCIKPHRINIPIKSSFTPTELFKCAICFFQNVKREYMCLPVVKDAVYHQPLHLDSIAVKLLLHMDKKRILVLPLGALAIITLYSKIHRWRFVHVSLPLVVTEHHLAVQLQLRTSGQRSRISRLSNTGFMYITEKWPTYAHMQQNTPQPQLHVDAKLSDFVSYLQLQHPGAVPVGHIAPFDKELPLPAARQRWGIRSVSR